MRLVSVSQHRRLEEPNLSEATGGNDSEGMVLDVDVDEGVADGVAIQGKLEAIG